MDGKQARRTGNSSPLGLLFDHGCDAFTAGFQTLMALKLLQVGNNSYILLGLLAPLMGFYFEIIHQYYTGKLVLGVGNGVTDGSVLMYGLYIFSGIKGNEVFKYVIKVGSFSMPFNILFLYLIAFWQLIAVISM